MLSRRKLIASVGVLATPYFFCVRTIKADPLNDGLVLNIKRVADNLELRPAGRQVAVAGGNTDFGRAVTAQANRMASNGRFTQVLEQSSYTSNVCVSSSGYTFARFQSNEHNFCCPIGNRSILNISEGYSGAMTLLEGPNFVALRVMTDLLNDKGYSASQIHDLVWPLTPCSQEVWRRERALIRFQSITSAVVSGQKYYADRDVLRARLAVCSLRYGHDNGVPNGAGEGELIVNGRVDFRFSFQYDKRILEES